MRGRQVNYKRGFRLQTQQNCTNCQNKFPVAANQAGRAKCPHCATVNTITRNRRTENPS